MNLLTALKISARGLSAERTRVNVAAMNLANAEVTKTVDGGPYRAKSVIFRSEPLDESSAGEQKPFISFEESLEQEICLRDYARGVAVYSGQQLEFHLCTRAHPC